MVSQRPQDLPARTPRRVVLRIMLRSVLTSTLLVALYFTVPLTRSLDVGATLLLVAGLVASWGWSCG